MLISLVYLSALVIICLNILIYSGGYWLVQGQWKLLQPSHVNECGQQCKKNNNCLESIFIQLVEIEKVLLGATITTGALR